MSYMYILLVLMSMLRVKSYLALFFKEKKLLNWCLFQPANGHVTGMRRQRKPDAKSNLPVEKEVGS